MAEHLKTQDVVAIETLTVEETKDLVFELKAVELNTLDDIEERYNGPDRKRHFVKAWIDRDKDASWEKLVSGLKQIEKMVLADKVKSEYCSASKNELVPISSDLPLQPVGTPPSQLAPAIPGNHAALSSPPVQERALVVRAQIKHFKDLFSDLVVEAQVSLSEAENNDGTFLIKVCTHVLALPVSKKALHIKFFRESEDEILGAKNVQKIIAILNRYCDYSNHEVIFCIATKYCKHGVITKIQEYQKSFTDFEVNTTVDIYLQAISALPQGEICKGFTRMTMKIKKPPFACSLYDIRQLKESIAEEASLHSYSVYIDSKQEGSVHVVLCVPPQAAGLIAVVMTAEFQDKHSLIDVTMDGKEINKYVVRIAF